MTIGQRHRTALVNQHEHAFVWWGDDPYLICHECGEIRDALTGKVVKKGRRV